MISGWYLDIIVGYLIRSAILMIKTRGSDSWLLQKAEVTDSHCDPASYGGPVAEVTYVWHGNGEYFSGIHREPFMLRSSAEEYVARFREGGDAIIRVKPGEPEVSVIRNRDQTVGTSPK